MIEDTSLQLFQQRVIGQIPRILTGAPESVRVQKLGRNLALAYMAGTSSQQAYSEFKNAGATDAVTGLCLLITLVYSILNKKSQVKSEIIRIEIKASLYDGLVTLVAISSLLLFSNIEFLSGIKEIGDSITVIILSIIYLYSPLKELIGQIKILIDRRRFVETEKELINNLQHKFLIFKFNDLYFAFSGDHYQIYISLYPKQNLKSEEITKKFQDIKNHLLNIYQDSKIYLLLSKEMIHNM